MTLRSTVFLLSALLAPMVCFSQQNDLSERIGRIALNVVIPEQIDSTMPAGAVKTLEHKLRQIANRYGTGAMLVEDPPFILTANTVVLSKDIISAAPPMVALSMEFSFYIGDGKKRKKYATLTRNIKGAGTNLDKAYNNAINNVNVDDSGIRQFVMRGKEKIINYYTENCAEVLKEADVLASQNLHGSAIGILISVPEDCAECFALCVDAAARIYGRYRNYNCKVLLLKARTQWAAAPDEIGASTVATILKDIDPEASCYPEVLQLIGDIGNTMKGKGSMDWELRMKEQEVRNEHTKEMQEMYKDAVKETIKKSNEPPLKFDLRGW